MQLNRKYVKILLRVYFQMKSDYAETEAPFHLSPGRRRGQFVSRGVAVYLSLFAVFLSMPIATPNYHFERQMLQMLALVVAWDQLTVIHTTVNIRTATNKRYAILFFFFFF